MLILAFVVFFYAALESLLTNTFLVKYLKGLCELAEAMDRVQNPTAIFEQAAKNIPESYRDAAIALFADEEEAVETGIEPTPELRSFVNILDDAACKDMYQLDMSARDIKAARYALQETHTRFVDEIVEKGKYKDLLPHYATEEELEEILKTDAHSFHEKSNSP